MALARRSTFGGEAITLASDPPTDLAMSDADLVRSPARGPSDSFAAQFARDGDGFLYRRNQKGPAIAVSVEERDAFVAAFSRWMDIQMLVVLIGGILAVVLAYVIFPAADYPMEGITLGVALVMTAVLIGLKRAWDAPSRALAERPHAAPALSAAEARRRALARTSWAQIALPGILSIYFFARYALRGEERWALAWLVIGLAGLAATAVRAYWKLRLR